jgi:hypothetical protein
LLCGQTCVVHRPSQWRNGQNLTILLDWMHDTDNELHTSTYVSISNICSMLLPVTITQSKPVLTHAILHLHREALRLYPKVWTQVFTNSLNCPYTAGSQFQGNSDISFSLLSSQPIPPSLSEDSEMTDCIPCQGILHRYRT